MKRRTMKKQAARLTELARAERRAASDSHLRCAARGAFVYRPAAPLRRKPPWVFRYVTNLHAAVAAAPGPRFVELDPS
jgi:hypothetical protein